MTISDKDDVFRFDVSMNDPFCMRGSQRIGNLQSNAQRLALMDSYGRRAVARFMCADMFTKSLAIDELSGDEMSCFGLSNLMDRDDVRMVQCRCRSSFLLKAFLSVCILRETGG